MIEDSELLAGLAFLKRYAHLDYGPTLDSAIVTVNYIRMAHKADEIRKQPTDDMELSVRSLAALRSLKLTTVGEVERFVNLTDREIIERGKKHYFGKKCLKEVRELLRGLGLGGGA